MEQRIEHLTRLFLMEKPHQLEYSYRKAEFKEDLPVLKEMVKRGLIKQIHKDTKKILYQYNKT